MHLPWESSFRMLNKVEMKMGIDMTTRLIELSKLFR